MRCILAACRPFGNDGRKAAGDSAIQVRTVDWHGMRRRAVDLAAVVGRFLTTGMFLVHIRFGRPGRIFVVANVAAGVVRRFLDLKRHPGVAVKTGGVRVSEKPWLERRHNQKHDRQHRAEGRNSCNRDSAKVSHQAPWDKCSLDLSTPAGVDLLHCNQM
jgi:hypothetical protein